MIQWIFHISDFWMSTHVVTKHGPDVLRATNHNPEWCSKVKRWETMCLIHSLVVVGNLFGYMEFGKSADQFQMRNTRIIKTGKHQGEKIQNCPNELTLNGAQRSNPATDKCCCNTCTIRFVSIVS
jgi:hypothetical protein